jgi:hypothetical protein
MPNTSAIKLIRATPSTTRQQNFCTKEPNSRNTSSSLQTESPDSIRAFVMPPYRSDKSLQPLIAAPTTLSRT